MTRLFRTQRHYYAILTLSFIVSGCITTPSLPQEQRPTYWAKELNRAENFYQISADVFRSEQPNVNSASQIKEHQIDIVINLRNRDLDSKQLKDQNLKLIHIPINTWSINREDLLQVMFEIQQAKAFEQKILIHCYHGSDRTGASIAMYRIIFEDWSTQDALNEMKYGGYGFHPIWINIEKIFTPENIKWIREQLSNPS